MKFCLTNKGLAAKAITLLALALILTGCPWKKTPNLEQIFAQARERKGKRPVIVIPGVLGSQLVNKETGEVVWLNLAQSKNDDLRLPISPDFESNDDALEAQSIIGKVKVYRFLPQLRVYQEMLDSIELYGGYRRGSWDDPGAGGDRDTYYVFPYDWRKDNVENARVFIRRVAALKQKLNRPDLQFNVLAHSMGALIARYALMYGDRDLSVDGEKPAPNWEAAAHFHKVFMFGAPNEGTFAAFEALLKGYSDRTILGRVYPEALNREVAFSSPAIFQLLPHGKTAKFYDENLREITLDLYDPQTWKTYGWSAIGDPKYLAQFAGGEQSGSELAILAAKKKRKDLTYAKTPREDLDAYFAAALKRARLFHEALDAPTVVPPALTLFAFGSDCDDTLSGAIVHKHHKTGAWQTVLRARSFKRSNGAKVSGEKVEDTIFSPGDGRVTRRSLLAETIAEVNGQSSLFKNTLPLTATFFCESHSNLPNSRVVQNNVLTALLSEAVR
jgi:pimeloyl-ACP methyl ester carboxylesterase